MHQVKYVSTFNITLDILTSVKPR